ncbi:hypothetical protein N7528_004245 [Penicillium herquei]|nr:hypothetical protein N7528_004245 [Penicillium herquei]
MVQASGDVVAEIQYLNPDPLYDEERPYSIAAQPPSGVKRTNITQTAVKTHIHNARGREGEFSLYSTGFEWIHHRIDYAIDSDQAIDKYMQEMGTLLQQHMKASRVIVYDFVIREQRGPREPRAPQVSKKVKKQILGAHLDIKRESAQARIRLKCGKEAEELLTRRWHIINIWRPLNGPVKSMPLAMCDSRTLAPDDIIESDIVLPHLQIQAYEVWYNPAQTWYYLKHQRSDEVLLMLSADSETFTRQSYFADSDTSCDVDDGTKYESRLCPYRIRGPEHIT